MIRQLLSRKLNSPAFWKFAKLINLKEWNLCSIFSERIEDPSYTHPIYANRSSNRDKAKFTDNKSVHLYLLEVIDEKSHASMERKTETKKSLSYLKCFL